MANMPKLFDICCENSQNRRALEIRYQLQITKDNFAFYENQKGSRTATCINVESLMTSDIEFKRKECIAVTQIQQNC